MSLDDVLTQFTLYEPADEAAIEAAQARFGVRFPADYLEFLRRSNGAMRSAVAHGGEGGFVVLHPVDDVGVFEESQAGKVVIGYNGGSFYFAFDVSREPPVYMALGIEDDEHEVLGTTLEEMLRRGLAGLLG